ncbi:hypothetical protein LIER_10749 [Lithospermum erythrorhizon]|uniref:GAG-pre-integrase domain-containing protein n=1 Tax=Lithospermum erythrorhizon TaxID=34254 RepID=A0AAV3PLR2_LITER
MEALKDGVHIVDSKLKLWHERLGHMSEKGLKVLAKRGLIPKVEDDYVLDCTHCLIGKQHRVSFNKLAQRKDARLDLFYSDVCGPMKTRTLGGCSYFFAFIDDYSRKLWVCP